MSTISFQDDILPLKNELFRLALRITQNRADAEDAVQDTMLKIWKQRDEWPQIDSIEAFCLTVCRNIALDKVRRLEHQLRATAPDARQKAESDLPSAASPPIGGLQIASPSPTPEAIAISNDRLRLVRRLISQLPEKQRSCIQLRDVEGKSYRDIATVLGITEQQVKVNIFRARQTIKQQFQKIK